jgi:hypothetical protein
MTGDDSIAIVLDTFGDRTTGYYFRVNAAGARQDGLITVKAVPGTALLHFVLMPKPVAQSAMRCGRL